MAKRNNKKPLRRYGVMYFRQGVRKWENPDTWGSMELLENAYGRAAQHVARSDLLPGEYRQAVVYDRHHGRIVRAYTRTAEGISIKDY
jgi:hypothetical protein